MTAQTAVLEPVKFGISRHRMKMILWWMNEFAKDWTVQGEIPLRIHESGMGQAFGLGSAPPFAPEFTGYIGELECRVEGCSTCTGKQERERKAVSRHANSRTRTTKAFRKLRKYAPREFDACYLAIVHGRSLTQIATTLTDRSYALGHDETYDQEAVLMLIISGMHKLELWY